MNKSLYFFEKLLRERPDYLPTYYPLAHLLVELRQPEKAEATFKQGIAIAQRVNDHKTFKELSSAYNDWLFERQ